MKLHKNPFFHFSLLLTGLLVWQVAGIVLAEQAVYTGPPGAPPNMTGVNMPLNTGLTPQTKAGALTIGNIKLDPTTNWLTFNVNNIPKAGFRFNSSNGNLEFATGTLSQNDWKSVGFGAGGGESFWVADPDGGIYYDQGNVRVTAGNNLVLRPEIITSNGYYYANSGSVDGYLTPRMDDTLLGANNGCDKDASKTECGSIYTKGVTQSSPTVAYDQYKYCTTGGGREIPTCFNRSVKYELKQSQSTTINGGGISFARLFVNGSNLAKAHLNGGFEMINNRITCRSFVDEAGKTAYGIPITYKVDVGGQGTESTWFQVYSSLESVPQYLEDRDGTRSYGPNPMGICILGGSKGYIDSVTDVYYLPITFSNISPAAIGIGGGGGDSRCVGDPGSSLMLADGTCRAPQ